MTTRRRSGASLNGSHNNQPPDSNHPRAVLGKLYNPSSQGGSGTNNARNIGCLIILLALLGLIGYYVWQSLYAGPPAQTVTPAPQTQPAPAPPPGGTAKPIDPNSELAEGIVGWWQFGGNAKDSSGYGNNGSTNGGLVIGGGSADFDGIDDAVVVPNSASLNPKDAITVSARWKSVDFTGVGNNVLVDKGFTSHSAPYYQYHLGVTGTGYPSGPHFGFSVTTGGRNYGVKTSQGYWSAGHEYHLIGTYDGSELRLYVNGVLVGKRAVSGPLDDFGQDLVIGAFTNNLDLGTPGTFREVAIWNRALSEKEIQEWYKGN